MSLVLSGSSRLKIPLQIMSIALLRSFRGFSFLAVDVCVDVTLDVSIPIILKLV